MTAKTAARRRPADADLDRVVGVFDGLMHRLMAGHAPELNAIELTMSQTKALYLVLAAGQLRMSELAARLGISSSTATGVVDGLVAMGLLVRHEDPADRRQVVVTATAEAEATLERFRELNSRRLREMLGLVAADDLGVIERALLILDDALATDQAGAPTATTVRHPEGEPA